MKRRFALVMLLGMASAASAEEVVIDFEQAQIGKPVPTWTEKGVVFKLARPLEHSKAAGRIMFFPHIATNHKGILNAMATEQAIPVQATFPRSASAVTLVLWARRVARHCSKPSIRMARSSTRHPLPLCRAARRPAIPSPSLNSP